MLRLLRHLYLRLGRVAAFFVAAGFGLPGCSAANDSNPNADASFTPPPPPRDAGCVLVRNMADDGGGCRIDWSCTDRGTLTFVCQPDDGRNVCVCLHNEEVEARPSVMTDVCAADGGPAAAMDLCGWMVAP
jgi:hypothetical protein